MEYDDTYSASPDDGPWRVAHPDVTPDERTFALFMHLSVLAHTFLPVVAILIPILMWHNKRQQSAFLDDHGREVINFHITLLLYALVLPIVVTIVGVLTCGIGLALLIPAIALPYALGLVGMVLGAMAANRGEFFRYPMCLRLIT